MTRLCKCPRSSTRKHVSAYFGTQIIIFYFNRNSQANEHFNSVTMVRPNASREVGRILLRSQVVADLALERSESFDLPKSLRLSERTPRHRLKTNKPYSTDLTSLGELAKVKITREKVISDVCKECGKGTERHNDGMGKGKCSGMDFARNDPSLVCNWRVLWYCLPPVRRRELLLKYYADKMEAHRKSCARGPFVMTFEFLGARVCKEAFQCLTGISSGTLHNARQAACDGHKSAISKVALKPMNQVLGEKYLDVRAWLEQYASSHAEQSPYSDEAWLPAGRRSFYYMIYVMERKASGMIPASETHFLKVWREAVAWLIVCTSLCKFVLCATCEHLKALIDTTDRGDVELMEALKKRLMQHYAFQSAQRLAQRRLQEVCDQSQRRKWFMKIDVMESSALALPVEWDQLASSFFKEGNRLDLSINGTLP